MKKILTYFFVTLGVIFLALIFVGAYVWFADPYEIRPLISMIFSDTSQSNTPTQEKDETAKVEDTTGDKNPALSGTQEQALEKIGIDPAKIPSKITPEMKACFVTKLGAPRVAEIEGGATPTPTEVLASRSCYE